MSQEVAIARHHLGFCQLLLTLQREGGREGREGGGGGEGGEGGRGGRGGGAFELLRTTIVQHRGYMRLGSLITGK